MPKLPPSSKYLQQADAAVDDVEREALTKQLSDAYADGRISQDEYMAAMDTLYGANSLGELVPVVEHLPAKVDDVPKGVQYQSSVPAGEVNPTRNIAVPALIVTGTLIALLVILGILGAAFFF